MLGRTYVGVSVSRRRLRRLVRLGDISLRCLEKIKDRSHVHLRARTKVSVSLDSTGEDDTGRENRAD